MGNATVVGNILIQVPITIPETPSPELISITQSGMLITAPKIVSHKVRFILLIPFKK